jgi:hypothetical protein
MNLSFLKKQRLKNIVSLFFELLCNANASKEKSPRNEIILENASLQCTKKQETNSLFSTHCIFRIVYIIVIRTILIYEKVLCNDV